MDRVLERAFQQAFSHHNIHAMSEEDVQRTKVQAEFAREEALHKSGAAMTAKDAIERIMLADKKKDYFRLLQLPLPEVDDLGRPTWDCSAGDVSKAYRKLSMLVHPDKNPGDDARAAFEALNKAYKALKDPGELEEQLKHQLEDAKARREQAEATASLEERVVINAQRNKQAKALHKQEGSEFQAEILRQMKAKQEAAKRKRTMRSSYRKEDDAGQQKQDDDGDENEEWQRRSASAAAKRKGKPRLIF